MENNNKDTKQKKSILSYFLTYLGHVWYDFKTSFKYNNMKFPAMLVAIPGIFLGFFLGYHAEVVGKLSYFTAYYDETAQEIVRGNLLKPFDFSGLVLFLMILFGILNIFTAVTMSSKKNLSSVVMATVTTALIVICGALYYYCVFFYCSLLESGKVSSETKFYDSNFIMSVISVGISMVTSVAGVVLGFIRYDRTYEKVDR